MGAKLDVTGERYGALVALYPTEQRLQNSIGWMFQCNCSNKRILPLNRVRYGQIKSCGCHINTVHGKRKQRDLIGKKFGSLTVVESLGQSGGKGHYISKVRCDCGYEFTTRDTFLVCGRKVQCPQCSREETIKHGMSDTPIFYVWQGMRNRCLNPNNKQYKNYGGRGIRICDEWADSNSFIEWAIQNGYEEGLQLDRKDVNGNYEPDNCRFVTQLENARNRQNTIYVHYEGQLMTIGEVADITGIDSARIYQRIHELNWSEYDATHIIPDSHYYTSKAMRRTTLKDIKTGEVFHFDSCSKASRFMGKKSTYLLESSYSHGNTFTCDNYIVEISIPQEINE